MCFNKEGNDFQEIQPKQPINPIYIPNNVDLDLLLNEFPINIPNAKDYLAYLLHNIHAVSAFSKNTDYENNDNYVPLSSSLLEIRVAKYAYLFDWLEEREIIKIKRSYRPGSNMGYKFTKKYHVELKEYQITTPTLVKSISIWKQPKKENPPLKPKHLYRYVEDGFGNTGETDHPKPEQIDHLPRLKLTTPSRSKLTRVNRSKLTTPEDRKFVLI